MNRFLRETGRLSSGNDLYKLISAKKGGSFLVITQTVDNSKNRELGERRGVEAHFHQTTSFHQDPRLREIQGIWVATTPSSRC